MSVMNRESSPQVIVTQYLYENYEEYREVILNYKDLGVTTLRINVTSSNLDYYLDHIRTIRSISEENSLKLNFLLDLSFPGRKYRIETFNEKEIEFFKNDELIVSYKKSSVEISIMQPCIFLENQEVFNKFKDEKEIVFDDSKYLFTVISSNESRMIIRAHSDGNLKNLKAVYSSKNIFNQYSLVDEFFSNEFMQFLEDSKPEGLILSFCEQSQIVSTVRKKCEVILPNIKIIPKIETKKAIDNLDNILQTCVFAMLGRGDLCIKQEDALKLMDYQNLFFDFCEKYNKKSIVATDILKSFESGQVVPNRAEIIDMSVLKKGADMIVVSAYLAKNTDMLRNFVEYSEKVY